MEICNSLPNGVPEAVAGWLALAVVVRPMIPHKAWSKLGKVGDVLDALFGNLWHAKNAKP